jgi:hypothetical protein
MFKDGDFLMWNLDGFQIENHSYNIPLKNAEYSLFDTSSQFVVLGGPNNDLLAMKFVVGSK